MHAIKAGGCEGVEVREREAREERDTVVGVSVADEDQKSVAGSQQRSEKSEQLQQGQTN